MEEVDQMIEENELEEMDENALFILRTALKYEKDLSKIDVLIQHAKELERKRKHTEEIAISSTKAAKIELSAITGKPVSKTSAQIINCALLKAEVMKRDKSKCVLSNIDIVEKTDLVIPNKTSLGIASHVLKKSEIEKRKVDESLLKKIHNEFDVKTSILLCTAWDKLFGKGLIAIADDRETILISKTKTAKETFPTLPPGITKLRLPDNLEKWPPTEFFSWHRAYFEKKKKRQY